MFVHSLVFVPSAHTHNGIPNLPIQFISLRLCGHKRPIFLHKILFTASLYRISYGVVWYGSLLYSFANSMVASLFIRLVGWSFAQQNTHTRWRVCEFSTVFPDFQWLSACMTRYQVWGMGYMWCGKYSTPVYILRVEDNWRCHCPASTTQKMQNVNCGKRSDAKMRT